VFYSTALPKSPGSAALARQFLDQIRHEVSLEVLENARLLVSELVANSIEHVREAGPGFSPPRRARGSDRGWGLHFVDRLSSRWAIDTDGRSRVWFELLTGD
jgi:hypothetical protein